MEERQVSVDGVPRPLPDPFVVCATQNPIEYEGTYPLPEAQLDRFLLKLTLPLPAREDEVAGARPARRRVRPARPRRGRASARWPGRLSWPPVEPRSAQVTGRPGGARLRRRRLPGDPRSRPRSAPGCLAPRRHRAAAVRPRLGVAVRSRTSSLPTTSRRWPAPPCGTGSGCAPRPSSRASPRTASSTACSPPSRSLADPWPLTGTPGAASRWSVPWWWPPWSAGPAGRSAAPCSSSTRLLVAAVLLDLALAGSVRALQLTRGRRHPGPARRAGHGRPARRPTPGRRTVRGRLRDAWPPSAGVLEQRHTVAVPPGERTPGDLLAAPDPTRRPARRPGDRPLHRAAWAWPRARGRTSSPGRCARCPRSRRASTCRPSWPGCASSTAGRRCMVRGQGTEFDSLREYVDGDDVRSIDWRATARAGRPRGADLAPRAGPARAARARHGAHGGRSGRRRPTPRRRHGRRAAARRPRLARPVTGSTWSPTTAWSGRRWSGRPRTRAPAPARRRRWHRWTPASSRPTGAPSPRRSCGARATVRSSCCSRPSTRRRSRRACCRCCPCSRPAPRAARLGRGPRVDGARGGSRRRGRRLRRGRRSSSHRGPRATSSGSCAARGSTWSTPQPDDLPPGLADAYLALKAAGRL